MFIWVNQGVVEPYVPKIAHGNIPKVNPLTPSSAEKPLEIHPNDFKELKEHGFQKGKYSHANEYETEEAYKKSSKKIYYALDIMSKSVIAISPNDSIEHAFQIFQEKKFRHLPIIKQNRTLFGIVSERDILKQKLKNLENPNSQLTLISQMSLRKTLTAFPLTPIRDIAKIMFDEKVGCVPILSKEDYTIQGIVTRSDILKAIMNMPIIELYG
ncbi:MAG: CBS domain-containing protein [Leptospiraceae bacterium]|nr:CBS domain-containing protein [Leptospiraceae bacterium]